MQDEPRITATFIPQMWIRDYAVPVEPLGEQKFDVTDALKGWPTDLLLDLQDDSYETDDLRDLPTAPEWIREWGGPFAIRVRESLLAYLKATGRAHAEV